MDNGDEAGALPGRSQQECAHRVAQGVAQHVHHRHPGVDGQGHRLQDQTQLADAQHIRILSGKGHDHRLRQHDQQHSHHRGTNDGRPGRKFIGIRHPVIPPGAPVEARHRLKAVAEAQHDAEGEHHDLGANTDTRQGGVGDITGNIVEHDGRHHRQGVAEHGRGAHADHFLHHIPGDLKILQRQAQHTALCDVGEDQNGKAHQLGDGGCQRSTGHTHIHAKNKNRIQNAIQNTAQAHAHHGKGGAAFAAQALVGHEVGRHKGRRHEHIGGIVDGILLTGGGSTQQPHHGRHKNASKDHQQRADAEGGKEADRQHLAGFFVLALAHKPGDIAVGTHRQQRAAHHDQLIQRGIDTHRRRGIGTQRAYKIGICQGVNGVDQKRDDGRYRHFGDHLVKRLIEHHQPPRFLTGIRGLFFHDEGLPFSIKWAQRSTCPQGISRLLAYRILQDISQIPKEFISLNLLFTKANNRFMCCSVVQTGLPKASHP